MKKERTKGSTVCLPSFEQNFWVSHFSLAVRNRARELVELLSDVEKIRTERKKAKTTKNKYVGVGNEGVSFGNFDVSSGSRYGGFGNDSLTSSSYGNYGNGGFRYNIETLLALIVRLQFRWK
jgi:hypothetical protein